MSYHKAVLLAFIFCVCKAAFAGNSFIYLADTTSKLFYGSNNEIYSPDKKQLLYFQKGNIIFNGDADTRQNIFLMSTSMDISSNKLQLLYEKDNRSPSYSFSNNKFYAGNCQSEDLRDKSELIHVQQLKKWLAFYSSINDSLLGFYAADSLPSSAAIIVAYTLIKRNGLEKKLTQQLNTVPFQKNDFATIKPIWGNQTDNEWMWDGKILRPRWNVDPRLAWTFDGETIKPEYGNNIYAQYSWDGETLKPTWRTNTAEEWNYDGHMFKRPYDTDWANQYIIEDGVVKPWSNVHPEKEWKMDGEIPLPIIIMVVGGIAHPF